MKKVSLIITVLNEEQTIESLLDSIVSQTILPNEVIIVDGGSTDSTLNKIRSFSKKNKKINIIVKQKKGNRSIGRNYAISLSNSKIIVITDAGCELEKNWLKELLKIYTKTKSTVVAGYYSAKPEDDFQRAVVPYVLVMPDKVDEKNFLPATRSMLIEKEIFNTMGGFDEILSDNEDYAFSKKLESKKINIAFARKAIVYWKPRKDLSAFYNMIFRFARGDAFAKIFRPKVFLIFLRYFVFIFLFFYSLKLFLALICFYTSWAIQKNKKYVDSGWKYLPVLQFVSDIAVMHGTIIGLIK